MVRYISYIALPHIQLVAIITYISTMNGFDESWCTEGDLCCVIAQLLDN